MAKHNILGKEGEAQACSYLLERQYTLLHTNWRYKRYELDIIATKNNELVVIEVKTRSAGFMQKPEDAVDTKKIKRIVSAADVYVRKFDLDMSVRFDIITVIESTFGYKIEHIDNAFYSPVW